ncbi:MAG: 3-isopropylmalate dehydratase small subunit [Proteobacteria bacterium]|nr:3-isopropylmalate dehydratase small subunit [Pseudomonadota bacterium]
MTGKTKGFECTRATMVVLTQNNIDTDQIIPARYLTTTVREGMGELLFYDWRRDGEGNLRDDCPLNTPEAARAGVLVAGSNFGCGSSREHAPWALGDFGFKAILSTDFADIFRANCLKNGLLPVAISAEVYECLVANPDARITIDLEKQELRYGNDGMCAFKIDSFSRQCMLEGIDELDFLLSHQDAIDAFEAGQP